MERVFAHNPEIWALAPCPVDPSLILTGFQTVAGGRVERRATLWRMPGLRGGAGGGGGGSGSASFSVPARGTKDEGEPPLSLAPKVDLEEVASFPAHERRIVRALWAPRTARGAETDIVTVDEQNVRLYHLAGPSLKVTRRGGGGCVVWTARACPRSM